MIADESTSLERIESAPPVAAPLPDEIRNAMILSLMPMARKMARGLERFARNADYEDCLSDGCIGIIRAVDTYDASRGVPLARYARPIITGAILNGLRDRDPVSEVVRRKIRRAERTRFERAQADGVLPTMQQMETEMPELRSARITAHRSDQVSLDEPLPAGERVPGDWLSDPALSAETRERLTRLAGLIKQLPDRMQEVVRMHYFEQKNTVAIGRQLNVTPQRISQLHHAALKQLRKAAAEL